MKYEIKGASNSFLDRLESRLSRKAKNLEIKAQTLNSFTRRERLYNSLLAL